jgi:hypothetical protein
VLTGLRDTSSEGQPPSQLLADLFLELTPRGQRLVPLFRAIYGARVPERLPEGVTARGLMEQGLPAAVVDALVLTDAVVPAIPRVGPALALRSGDTGERSPLPPSCRWAVDDRADPHRRGSARPRRRGASTTTADDDATAPRAPR